MNPEKTSGEKNLLALEKEETYIDNEFAAAFAKCSHIFKQLIKNVEKNSDMGKSKRFESYSRAYQGFAQNNVSKPEGFSLKIKVKIKFSGPKKKGVNSEI